MKTRSETVTIRLDPKLKFFSMIAARSHRRSISSFIEWATEQCLRKLKLELKEDSLWEICEKIWDVDDETRFENLVKLYPEILTYEEQVKASSIREGE